MSDDEEPTVFYHDAREGLLSSVANKQKKALKHFHFFFQKYCMQIGVDVVDVADIPYHGLPPSAERSDDAIFDFWDKLWGAFVTYMGSDAKAGCKPTGARISQATAEGYCSSVKVYFENRFRTKPELPVFQEKQWKKLREKLKAFFPKRKSTGAAPSTRQDRESLASACIWLGTPEFAEFWSLLNATYHCSGRGTETSLNTPEDNKVVDVNESLYSYEVLAVELQRQKDGLLQTLPIYPHRDNVLEDFYFSLIHHLVINGCDHEYTFPIFSKAALKTNKSGKSESDVCKEWTKHFKQLRNSFEMLADEINEELTSHSNRKGSNQQMAETPKLGFAGIHRTGFSSVSIHTVFDYHFGSLVMSHQAGKALSKWTASFGDTIIGGQPPTFDDITTEVEHLQRFTDILFEDDTMGRWKPKVRELLVMTLLLRYDQFCDILLAHPFQSTLVEDDGFDGPVDTYMDYSNPTEEFLYTLRSTTKDRLPEHHHHRFTCPTLRDNFFICKINQALRRADADAMFSSWVEQTRKAFISRNLPALPIQTFQLYGENPSDGILMDPRTFTDHFNGLASVAQANHMELQRHRHMLNDIQNAITNESRITSSFIVGKIFNIERTLQRLEVNLVGEALKTTTQRPAKGVIRFSVRNTR